MWCLALLDEPITLPGDDSPTLPYLAITNRHDGTAACALRATAVRIVCANTFRAAELEGERTGATFSFIHKSSWRNRIDEARRAVTGAQAEMRRYADLARDLLAIHVTPAQRELFITEFIPKPPEGLITDRVARNIGEARAALRMIFETKTTEHVADTAYGLVQAAGEYLDHVRTARTWETRLNRTLIRPEPLKHRALVPGPGHHHHNLTHSAGPGGLPSPGPASQNHPLPRERQGDPRHVPRYQRHARARSPGLAARHHRPARTLRALRPAGGVPVPGQGRALPQGLRRDLDHHPRAQRTLISPG